MLVTIGGVAVVAGVFLARLWPAPPQSIARAPNVLIIGVDSNQNAIKPGRVLTSMLKRVDNAVYEVIKAQVKGTFQSGTHSFGLKDKGIDYAVDSNNEAMIAPFTKKLEEVRADIVSGKIVVPDYYKKTPSK